MTLRAAQPEDSEFAYQIRKAALAEYVPDWNEVQERARHQNRFARLRFQVIAINGEDVGILATCDTPDSLTVHQLFLSKVSQSQGIGSHCMQALMKESKGRPISLRVKIANPRALAFYQRLGFTVTHDSDSHIHMQWNPGAQEGLAE